MASAGFSISKCAVAMVCRAPASEALSPSCWNSSWACSAAVSATLGCLSLEPSPPARHTSAIITSAAASPAASPASRKSPCASRAAESALSRLSAESGTALLHVSETLRQAMPSRTLSAMPWHTARCSSRSRTDSSSSPASSRMAARVSSTVTSSLSSPVSFRRALASSKTSAALLVSSARTCSWRMVWSTCDSHALSSNSRASDRLDSATIRAAAMSPSS
mmetsp:Transcript_55127/g.147111  ORF Transcript_55127/g.147111 Transcript_55127/m.147111 type:complete len:221 (-) Transcript_55127:61-723(-)